MSKRLHLEQRAKNQFSCLPNHAEQDMFLRGLRFGIPQCEMSPSITSFRPFAAQLPELIMQGVEKGKTGEKIDIDIDTLAVRPQTIITTKDNIQIIVKANGRASLGLEKKIFDKKKKT